MTKEEIEKNHHDNLDKIALEVMDTIEKYYPGLTKKTYDNCGYPDKKGTPTFYRIRTCLYIEFMKAAIFNEPI